MCFVNSLISRLGTLEWPPRSLDMAIQNFFFWGYIKNKFSDALQPQQPITIQQLSITIMRESKNNKTRLIAWSTDAVDVKMLLDIHSLMNVMNDDLALNLADIYLDNTIQIVC